MSFIQLPIFHPPRLLWQCFWCLLLLTGSPFAAQFQGTATSFGKQQCFMLDHFPADSGATYRDNDAKKDQEKLQGDWTLQSGERDGESFPEDVVKTLKRSGCALKPGARAREQLSTAFANPNTTAIRMRLSQHIVRGSGL